MPTAKRRSRVYDPDRTWAALTAQVRAVSSAAHALKPEQLALPSGLPGWDVRLLLVHIVGQIEAVRRLLGEEPPAVARAETDLPTWAVSTAAIAELLDDAARERAERIEAESGGGADGGAEGVAAGVAEGVAAALDTAAEGLVGCRDEALRAGRLVPHRFGAMTALDFTVTRLVELVVHSDDLARATGADVPLDRQALAAVVRLLADALAAKAPGGAVEVRIPPYAAVQCGAGPQHTRGTPPNVVETDPVTWIRLATGRTPWADALADGLVSAGGERADLADLLPVLG